MYHGLTTASKELLLDFSKFHTDCSPCRYSLAPLRFWPHIPFLDPRRLS